MKITALNTHLINTPIPEAARVESGAGFKLNRQMCLLEIVTDEGVKGYGSPSGPYDLEVLRRILSDVIGPHLVGQDPSNIPYLWHKLYHGEVSRNLGHRSVGIAALSAVDIALWDLKGKVAGLPIYELLGGRYHIDGVRAYASSIYWDLSPDEATEQARGWLERGFGAFKLKVGRRWREDCVRLRCLREALGPETTILTDANQSLGRNDALSLLNVLEEVEAYWFEEPISVDDIEGHRLLRERRSAVRIATGENLYTRFSFADFVKREAVDVLQADASRVGGISEARLIAEMAAAHHLEWNPHTFNDIITVAANLHLVAASPHPAMFEWDITHNDLMTELADLTLELDGGRVRPPQGPGLGIEIDWDFVKAHRWQGEPAIGAGHGMRS